MNSPLNLYFYFQDIPEMPERKMTDQINEVTQACLVLFPWRVLLAKSCFVCIFVLANSVVPFSHRDKVILHVQMPRG